MKLIVNGRNIELTEAIKAYVSEKIGRLEHHYDFIQEIHVFLSVEKNPRIQNNQLAEATVVVNRAVLRVEVSSQDLYGSIDQLVDKIERVLTRHKTKLLGRAKSAKGESIRHAGFEEEAVATATEEFEEIDMEGVYLTYEDEGEAAG
ncbi:MAG TPA: ribosome-associated translation inhibitor RaiA [Oculatellaceae cyanobacterium]|jgi:putative sigma-54 modulation protein